MSSSFERIAEQLPSRLANTLGRLSYWPINDASINSVTGVWKLAGDKIASLPAQVRKERREFMFEMFETLGELDADILTLSCGILTPLLEITSEDEIDVREFTGETGQSVLAGCRVLMNLKFEPPRDIDGRQAEYFRRLILAMTPDLRAILILLAWRLIQLRKVNTLEQEPGNYLASAALEVYAPLAHRLGIGRFKWELEDRAFRQLDNETYSQYADLVAERRAERQAAIDRFIEPIREHMAEEGLSGQVYGRPKHIYSIFNKIRFRNKQFEDILDLLAVRILVPTVKDCYHTLSLVHSIYDPLLNAFGDYIARPKQNLYRSLHTKVIDWEGRIVEVQIRTHEMHLVAEKGIAAHWQYKEGITSTGNTGARYYKWVRDIIGEISNEPEAFVPLKVQLFRDFVFVYSPKGELMQLPRGATPVDFAFAIHSDLGLSTQGATVNGRIVTLDYELHNLDVVNVQSGSAPKPSRDWLAFVKSPRARQKIKHVLKQKEYDKSLSLGRDMLKQAFSDKLSKPTMQELTNLAGELGYDNLDDLFAAVGAGDQGSGSVVSAWERHLHEQKDDSSRDLVYYAGRPAKLQKSANEILVDGSDNLEVNYASCCHPVPGDDIFGYISKSRGIVVHRRDCPNAANLLLDAFRLIDVEWNVERPATRFRACLKIFTGDRPNMVRDLAEVLSREEVNVVEMNLRTEDGIGVGITTVEVTGQQQLDRLIRQISGINGVDSVQRVGE